MNESGTADITCHELLLDGTIKELHQPSGGDFGGTNVDNEFLNVLVRIFGADVLKDFKYNYTSEYWGLMNDFETKKRNFNGSERLNLKIPAPLRTIFESTVGCSVGETLQNSAFCKTIKLKVDKMSIDADQGKQLFDGTIKQICIAASDLIGTVNDIEYIILVGGFSESPYLQIVMKQIFGTKIIVPKEPSNAVVMGAVMFGHDPAVITSRICRYTYGIAQVRKFKTGQHPERKKVLIDGIEHCDDIFNKHIEIGAEVSLALEETAKEHEYFPAAANAKQAVLEVYASTEKDPMFIDDVGCVFVGLVKIDIDPKGNYWAKHMVKLCFGGTELKIQIRDVKHDTTTSELVTFLG